jgi:subtilisin family serine protease
VKLQRLIASTASAVALTVALAGAEAAPGQDASGAKARAQAAKDKIAEEKARPDRSLSPLLARLKARSETRALQRQAAPKESVPARIMNRLMRASGGYVTVDVVARGDAASLSTELESKGMVGTSNYGKIISGRLPVAALTDVSSSLGVVGIRPAVVLANTGLTYSQGARAMRTDAARRTVQVRGRNVRVGVLSDSFNCLAGPLLPGNPYTTAEDDQRSGDLMPDIIVLKDLEVDGVCDPFATDEGRAMMQIVRDVAPAASGAFHTAYFGSADFAIGILRLAQEAKSDVIVDDIIYLAEPMFQDGIIAQAADIAYQSGVPYFSSAGNRARQSWQGKFRNSHVPGNFGIENRFGPGNDTRQTMRISDGAFEILSFQWDQPYISAGPVGTTSDLDIYFYDADGNLLPDCDTPDAAGNLPLLCQYWGASDNIAGGDPIELAAVFNGTGASVDVQIGIELYSGPAPDLMKYVYFDSGAGFVESLEYATNSPTSYGHNNARGAEAVGAAAWYRTSKWGNPLGDADKCTPACLEYFSSAGGTPILFNGKGQRLKEPVVRVKPGVTGPDRVNTTFFFADFGFAVLMEPDGFPNFAGTSASAPHVAGVAALMLQASDGQLGPQQVYNILRNTAQDMLYRRNEFGLYDFVGHGYDHDTGFGFVDAYRAVCRAAGFGGNGATCQP